MKFYKMHGLGNDFMVIDAVNQSIDLSREDIRRLSRRDTGVGFDQCLLIEPSSDENIDFNYRIYNADGSEVGQCGNGARCVGRFIHFLQLSDKTNFRLKTLTTEMDVRIEEHDLVSVILPPPKFIPEQIPLKASTEQSSYTLILKDDHQHSVHAVNVGNPHAVTIVQQLKELDIERLGPQISQHPDFPEQCNAGFMQVVAPDHLNLRVYERGAGETQACGSGAVAAAVIGRAFYQMTPKIKVSLSGGDLEISWLGDGHPITLTGPAEFIYHGELME